MSTMTIDAIMAIAADAIVEKTTIADIFCHEANVYLFHMS